MYSDRGHLDHASLSCMLIAVAWMSTEWNAEGPFLKYVSLYRLFGKFLRHVHNTVLNNGGKQLQVKTGRIPTYASHLEDICIAYMKGK